MLGRRGSSSLSRKYLHIKDKRCLRFEKENGIDQLGQNVGSRHSKVKASSPFASRSESFLHPTYIMSHFHGRCPAIIRALLASHGTARPWNPIAEDRRVSDTIRVHPSLIIVRVWRRRLFSLKPSKEYETKEAVTIERLCPLRFQWLSRPC